MPLEDRGLQFGESALRGRRRRPRRALPSRGPRRQDAERRREIGLAVGVPSLSGWQLDRRRAPPARAPPLGDPLRADHRRDRPTLARAEADRRAPSSSPTSVGSPSRLRTQTARGIAAVTLADQRWQRSDLKTVMLLPAVLARKEALARGADEAIFVGQRRVRERGGGQQRLCRDGPGGDHAAGEPAQSGRRHRNGGAGDLPRGRGYRSRSALWR